MYYVATGEKLKIGDKLTADFKEFSARGAKVINEKRQINGVKYKDFILNVFKDVEGAKTEKDKIALYETAVRRAAFLLDEYDFVFRELALEIVRVRLNPDLPSRLAAMFLGRDRAVTIETFKKFCEREANKSHTLVAVRVSGNIFTGNPTQISRRGDSFDGYTAAAQEYWEQSVPMDTDKWFDCLFYGTAEVVEIVDRYSPRD
jgi:hypothetical protein